MAEGGMRARADDEPLPRRERRRGIEIVAVHEDAARQHHVERIGDQAGRVPDVQLLEEIDERAGATSQQFQLGSRLGQMRRDRDRCRGIKLFIKSPTNRVRSMRTQSGETHSLDGSVTIHQSWRRASFVRAFFR